MLILHELNCCTARNFGTGLVIFTKIIVVSQDDREQEGYEKPWDWKPHQKDERPMAEYDAPWDQRAKHIEQNIVKAKSAKEIQSKYAMLIISPIV